MQTEVDLWRAENPLGSDIRI